ncbi:phosphoglycerate mutase [Colwellia sp. 75C3]|uniref:histidine phosphatase family protein n=1 Tax=Colwellia sp. 75C3 TaxID=888425 RepID=UPI000C341B14|nr:histidine phosphatase family protein [Colwellia sp. 75C3]PKG85854.1 phosphoglycerate mutase [Colwellia sp. 75C3]
MLEIDLIRHVKVDGKPALYGCTDVTPIASENARLLESLISQQQTNKAYQSIVCSPLTRCQFLAKEFSRRCDLPLEISPNLQEMNFGRFDGIAFDDLYFEDCFFEGNSVKNEQHHKVKTELHWSQLEAFFQAPAEIVLPGAEALSDFNHRVVKAWQDLIAEQVTIVTKKKESAIAKRILVVAHGGVIRMILAHILQLDWQKASWHQKLQIGHGSMSRIIISQPYQYEQLHQQVTSIAMPFLEEL